MVYIQKLKYLCILKNCHRCSKTLWQKREEETVFSISYDGGKIPFFHFEKISFLLVYNIGNVEKNQLSLWIPANLLIKKIILKIITTDLIWRMDSLFQMFWLWISMFACDIRVHKLFLVLFARISQLTLSSNEIRKPTWV